jgi:tetratricopeptide (TPR) repeat protein
VLGERQDFWASAESGSVSIHPDSADGEYAMGQVWENRGDLNKALENYSEAVRKQPHNEEFRNAYERVARKIHK